MYIHKHIYTKTLFTILYWWKTRIGTSQLEPRIRLLSAYSNRSAWSTLRLGLMDQSGKKYGLLTYLPRCALSFGVHDPIFCPRETTWIRGVKNEQRCDICGQEPEITSHILWECPLARNVWALVKGRLQECSNMKQDFFLLFQHLVAKLELKDLERWTVVSWAIWNLRGHRPSRR